MKNGSRTEGVLWMVAGAVVLALALSLVWHFRQDPAQRLASKASRVDLVGRLQVDLASASEAEKSAVLAITDEESQAFADQARAATTEVERERLELDKLLATGAIQRERDLLAQFSAAFETLRRIDDEVLRLAVKNTNLKAYALLFGPAAEALAEMDAALARLEAWRADSPDAKRVTHLACGARIGVQRIQILLAPHIAEESDAKMDQMEVAMGKSEVAVREDLDGLASLSKVAGDADRVAAAASFVRYGEVKARILTLSRENTNVRSLALSLNQKRKAMVVCVDALNALRQAILEEPIAGVTYGRQQMPR